MTSKFLLLVFGLALALPSDCIAREEDETALSVFPTNSATAFISCPFPPIEGTASTERILLDLCPLSLSATNPIVVSSMSGHPVSDPRTLASRLVAFVTDRPDHRVIAGRPAFLVQRRGPQKYRRSSSPTDGLTDEELRDGALENARRRRLLFSFLSANANKMDAEVQREWFFAFVRIWILPPYYPDGGYRRAAIRREEDGISSAEALLEWFAENESFCESVRTDAKARLESLEKNPAPKPDAQPVATTAAEGREQDARPVPEDVSSTAPNETEENKAP